MLAQSQSPGNEQRDFWSSQAADTPGSRNLSGIKDPVVDALVDRVIFATDRDDLLAATHALDRVLLWNYYVVPQWHLPEAWIAYWNKFGIPEKQPSYIGVDIESWWIDTAKEAALQAKYKSQQLSGARGLSRRGFPGARRVGRRLAAARRARPSRRCRTDQPLHGLSAFGDLKYRPDFTHFDYVNADAPKGGLFNFQPPNWLFNQSTQTFNTLNILVPSGDAPPRMEMCFDSLMALRSTSRTRSTGCWPKSVTISDDRNSFDFELRPGGALARRHAADGRGRRLLASCSTRTRAIPTCADADRT